MPVTPTNDANLSAASTYADFSGLHALERGAAAKDPAAIRQVAKQFESMFTRMMLKSMRDAVGKDPIFGSDQEETYQGMYDDQLSLQLTRGRGLGLADMLIRQLQKLGVPGANDAAKKGSPALQSPAVAPNASQPIRGRAGNAARAPKPGAMAISGDSARGSSQVPTASRSTQLNFIRGLWPQAQKAGAELGVGPQNLIAQAALETNWGQNMPRDAAGRSSNNLFGIKATAAWNGNRVAADTTEYQQGQATSGAQQFRSYPSTAHSFQDYVALLRNSPRYAGALNTGADARAFAAGLQRGGYATDPDYVHKVSAVAGDVTGALALKVAATQSFKSVSALPITADTKRALGAVTDG